VAFISCNIEQAVDDSQLICKMLQKSSIGEQHPTGYQIVILLSLGVKEMNHFRHLPARKPCTKSKYNMYKVCIIWLRHDVKRLREQCRREIRLKRNSL
jgi:hypothetical protein